MKYTLPTVRELREIVKDPETSLRFIVEKGIIAEEKDCEKCGHLAKLSLSRQTHRCTKFECRSEVSCKKGTFFSGHRLGIHQILEIAYYWLAKATHTQIETYTGVCDKTVTSIIRYMQQLVGDSLDDIDMVIGGQGVEVEIDETKLGKRKYHRGHRVEGVWVLVGVERTPERKVFLRTLENRNLDTLTMIIQQHVALGSKIITDCWKGYRTLAEFGYTHITVNHSETFRDPNTGACTNTVEGTNYALKSSIPLRKRTKECEDNLWEFIWRRKHVNCLWESFIKAMLEVAYE